MINAMGLVTFAASALRRLAHLEGGQKRAPRRARRPLRGPRRKKR